MNRVFIIAACAVFLSPFPLSSAFGASGGKCADLFAPFSKTKKLGDEIFNRFEHSWLGPAVSPGLYYARTTAEVGVGLRFPAVLRIRDLALEKMPRAAGWQGRKSSLTSRQRLSSDEFAELTVKYNALISAMKSSRMAHETRARRKEIVFLASIYPEVHAAFDRTVALRSSIPRLAQPNTLRSSSITEYRLDELVVATLTDIYLYGSARYAHELHLVGRSPIMKSVVEAFQKTNWRPLEPEQSLRDLEYLEAYFTFPMIIGVLKSETAYAALARRFVIHPESFQLFAETWSQLMQDYDIQSGFLESDLNQHPQFASGVRKIIQVIEKRWPTLDRNTSELLRLTDAMKR